jgi:multiple sugar transport system substrate-binding protein
MQAFLPLLYGAGGMLYDWEKSKWVVSSPAYLDALFFYRTVYAEGLANPDVPTIVNPWNVALGDFQAGKTAIYCDGQWAWGAFKPGADFEVLNAEVAVGFIKIPGEEAGFSTFSGGHAYAIANKGLDILTPFPDAAFKLLSVHLSQERMADFCLEKEWVAPRLDVARVPEYAENKYLAWCVARVLPYTEYRPALPEYSDVSLQIQLMVERVATLEMTPEQALTEFAKAVVGIVGPENTIDELSLLK